jgi:hypothetical protein
VAILVVQGLALIKKPGFDRKSRWRVRRRLQLDQASLANNEGF